MTFNQDDPFEVASTATAKENSGEYYGLANVKVSFVKLVKGQGKIEWNPETDGIEERRTNVWIQIEPLSDKATFIPERQIIAESKAWTGIVWASIKSLGVRNLRDLDGKYCKYVNEPTGRKWTNAQGEEKTETVFKFLALYGTRAEAEAARGGNGHSNAPATPATTAPKPAADTERELALTFVAALVKASKGDKAQLAKQIAGYPVVNKFFTIESPEIAALLAQAA